MLTYGIYSLFDITSRTNITILRFNFYSVSNGQIIVVPYILCMSNAGKRKLLLSQSYISFKTFSFVNTKRKIFQLNTMHLCLFRCYSPVGRQYRNRGMQELSIGEGCNNKGIIMHELMHALGFWHEQARSDRDDYLEVLWENIKKGTLCHTG